MPRGAEDGAVGTSNLTILGVLGVIASAGTETRESLGTVPVTVSSTATSVSGAGAAGGVALAVALVSTAPQHSGQGESNEAGEHIKVMSLFCQGYLRFPHYLG